MSHIRSSTIFTKDRHRERHVSIHQSKSPTKNEHMDQLEFSYRALGVCKALALTPSMGAGTKIKSCILTESKTQPFVSKVALANTQAAAPLFSPHMFKGLLFCQMKFKCSSQFTWPSRLLCLGIFVASFLLLSLEPALQP